MEAREIFEPSSDTARQRPTALDPGTGEALKSAAEEAGAAVEQLCRIGSAYIGREAQDRPYRVIGIAAGIGFILGGGLAWRMAGRLLNVAGRIAVTQALEDWATTEAREFRKERHS
jgi:ElaB/YqjD/DUF883 family membrane-anchored ribosome-binding protein